MGRSTVYKAESDGPLGPVASVARRLATVAGVLIFGALALAYVGLLQIRVVGGCPEISVMEPPRFQSTGEVDLADGRLRHLVVRTCLIQVPLGEDIGRDLPPSGGDDRGPDSSPADVAGVAVTHDD